MVKAFLLFIFFNLSCVASEISCVDRDCNPCFDCRPNITRYNQEPKIPVDPTDNQFGIFCGLICLPVNIVWRTITCPCQDSLFCCDVLCARCAVIGGGSTCCGSSYYPDRFGICADSSPPPPSYTVYTPPAFSPDKEPYLDGGSYNDDLHNRITSNNLLSDWISRHGYYGQKNTSSAEYRVYILTDGAITHYLTRVQANQLISDISTGALNLPCKPRVEKR